MTVPVILLGFGGNVLDTIDDVNDAGGNEGKRYEVVGYLVDREEHQGKLFEGYPVLGRFAAAVELAERYPEARFTTWIGGVSTYLQRPQVIAGLGLAPERWLTLVHPTTYVSRRTHLGRGVLIFQNCTITNKVVIGDHVVILPQTVISHDDVLGDYTVVTGAAALSGNVKVGRNCYLGTNCSIHPNVTIGEGSLIGMGSVVRHNVEPYKVVAGTPARVLRDARP